LEVKILWCGDFSIPSGFSKVTTNICDRLHAQHDWDISILAINYNGDHFQTPHALYPAGWGADYTGFARYEVIFNKVQPDIVLVLNDAWIAERFVALHRELEYGVPIVTYIPVDAKNFKPAWAKSLSAADLCIWYTEFGKEQAVLAGLDCHTAIIPHGVDTDLFRPMDKLEARKSIGLPLEGFIFGNVNRNQPRKRQDLTIQYFAEWVKSRDIPADVYLYLHCAQQDGGWDLTELAEYYGIQERLLIPGLGLTPVQGIKETSMPLVYNALDCQLSTTEGEGWGLIHIEGMACGTVQIAPDYAALGEWAKGAAYLVPCTASSCSTMQINTIGGIVDKGLFIEALDRIYRDEELREELGAKGFHLTREPAYDWDAIAEQFNAHLTRLIPGKKPIGMGEVIQIEDYKPRITIQTADGNAHVTAAAMWEDFVSGKFPLQQIQDGELMLRAITGDWLKDLRKQA
jgi:glycosyltransferase involved in cell wall biosynthesis